MNINMTMKPIAFSFMRILLIVIFLFICFRYKSETWVRKPNQLQDNLNNNNTISRLGLSGLRPSSIQAPDWICQKTFPVTTKTSSSARSYQIISLKVTPVVLRVWGPSTGCSITTSELPGSSTVRKPSPTPLMDNSPSSITWSLCWRDGGDQYRWLSMLPARTCRTPLTPFSTSGLHLYLQRRENNNQLLLLQWQVILRFMSSHAQIRWQGAEKQQ